MSNKFEASVILNNLIDNGYHVIPTETPPSKSVRKQSYVQKAFSRFGTIELSRSGRAIKLEHSDPNRNPVYCAYFNSVSAEAVTALTKETKISFDTLTKRSPT